MTRCAGGDKAQLPLTISLRLPADLETRLAGFGSRTGLSKSAVIVRSIQEFLARNATPTSFQIYEEVMGDAGNQRGDVKTDLVREASEQRSTKLATRQVLRNKHAGRSERATNALAKNAMAAKRGAAKST